MQVGMSILNMKTWTTRMSEALHAANYDSQDEAMAKLVVGVEAVQKHIKKYSSEKAGLCDQLGTWVRDLIEHAKPGVATAKAKLEVQACNYLERKKKELSLMTDSLLELASGNPNGPQVWHEDKFDKNSDLKAVLKVAEQTVQKAKGATITARIAALSQAVHKERHMHMAPGPRTFFVAPLNP
jgi:hypothetical protein